LPKDDCAKAAPALNGVYTQTRRELVQLEHTAVAYHGDDNVDASRQYHESNKKASKLLKNRKFQITKHKSIG